jgi:uncharacterized membrane-anchored protein
MEKKSDRPNKNREIKRLVITLIVIFSIIGTFIFYLSWPLLTGQTITLATRPVDPFDPLRGQYMTINYEISSISLTEEMNQGDKIYISLKPDKNDIWRLDKSTLTKPTEGVFIKGTVTRIRGNNTNIKYGIEQFFFERNANVPTRGITVQAKIDNTGQARITNLLHEGEPIEAEYKPVSLTS